MFEYERYRVTRPQHVGDDYWHTVEAEVERLDRSLTAGDLGQAIGDIKCLVESVAKATLDVAGTLAGPGGSFDGIVKAAHDLLASQPGNELANASEFGRMATQACKIVRNLGPIRNEFGGGHGRARQPRVVSEMAEMAIDAGLLWTRWALRRLGLYSFGRPAALIRDLVEDNAIFRSGELRARLEAANLPALEDRHQRSVGVAVGQRSMQNTIVVRDGGLTPCLSSDDVTELWTADYRVGLAYGLLFQPDERPTITDASLRMALTAWEPLEAHPEDLEQLVDRIVAATQQRRVVPAQESHELRGFVLSRRATRPAEEHEQLERLADHITPDPF